MDKFKNKYYDNELFMIGALDCFGVPHTPDNTEHKSYLDLVASYFEDMGIEVNYINMHSLGCNRTEHLLSILDKDYSKGEYYIENKRMTKKAIDKEGIFPFPIHETFLDDYYDNPNKPELKITSYLSDAKNPIFFYSCGQMDFHKFVCMRSNDLKLILPQLTFHLKTNFIKTLDNIEQTVKYIMSINPSVEIYMFGVYPMFIEKSVRELLAPIYGVANILVSRHFNEYENVHYVDVMGNINYIAEKDCHPNFLGQQYMKKKVLNTMYKKERK